MSLRSTITRGRGAALALLGAALAIAAAAGAGAEPDVEYGQGHLTGVSLEESEVVLTDGTVLRITPETAIQGARGEPLALPELGKRVDWAPRYRTILYEGVRIGEDLIRVRRLVVGGDMVS